MKVDPSPLLEIVDATRPLDKTLEVVFVARTKDGFAHSHLVLDSNLDRWAFADGSGAASVSDGKVVREVGPDGTVSVSQFPPQQNFLQQGFRGYIPAIELWLLSEQPEFLVSCKRRDDGGITVAFESLAGRLMTKQQIGLPDDVHLPLVRTELVVNAMGQVTTRRQIYDNVDQTDEFFYDPTCVDAFAVPVLGVGQLKPMSQLLRARKPVDPAFSLEYVRAKATDAKMTVQRAVQADGGAESASTESTLLAPMLLTGALLLLVGIGLAIRKKLG